VPHESNTQRERATELLGSGQIMRLHELVEAGIAATTVARMVKAGEIVRLGRGLYQVANADFGGDHVLAEVAKTIPKGVICLLSALAFYELTDQIPAKVWIAIGLKDWKPNSIGTPLRIVRMPGELLHQDVERHTIEGVPVPIFSIPRTLADCFRHQRRVGLTVAFEALGEALRNKRTTPGAIAAAAEKVGSWKVMRPYLEALTING
jgi:predicted transcriptional regulator of viral defense system